MFFFSSILLCFLNCTAVLQYFPAFLDPGVFFQDPKTIPNLSQNYPKSIPTLSNNYSKRIPKQSRNDPSMSPKCISASATPQPHSRPSAHIHPSRGGRRSPRAARCCGAPERESFCFFTVFFGGPSWFWTPQERAWDWSFWVGRRKGSPKSTQL